MFGSNKDQCGLIEISIRIKEVAIGNKGDGMKGTSERILVRELNMPTDFIFM